QRRVNRRKLAAKNTLAAVDVDEVIQKPMLVRTLLQQKRQRLLHPLLAQRSAQIIPLGSNAERRQPKAGSGNAGHSAQREPYRRRAVSHQPALCAHFVVEEVAPAALHIVQQGVGFLGNLGQRPVDENARPLLVFLCGLLFGCWLLTRFDGRLLLLVLHACCKGRGRRAQYKHARGACCPQQLPASYLCVIQNRIKCCKQARPARETERRSSSLSL